LGGAGAGRSGPLRHRRVSGVRRRRGRPAERQGRRPGRRRRAHRPRRGPQDGHPARGHLPVAVRRTRRRVPAGEDDMLRRARSLAIGYDSTTRLDAVLAPEATLAVTVTGLPAGRSAIIDAVTLSGAPVGFSADLQGAGTVTVRCLPASKVKLRVSVYDRETE